MSSWLEETTEVNKSSSRVSPFDTRLLLLLSLSLLLRLLVLLFVFRDLLLDLRELVCEIDQFSFDGDPALWVCLGGGG